MMVKTAQIFDKELFFSNLKLFLGKYEMISKGKNKL